MTEDLRVDTGLVREAGGRLEGIAADIPDPPAAHSPTGADALSTAIAGKVAEVVDPVIAQMPIAKEELTRYAQNVVNAAGAYDASDREVAEQILQRVEKFDKAVDDGSVGGGGASSSMAGAAQQTGQMAQMPIQMAQQAAQVPMQMAGMAGAIPHAVQQGAQQAVQQVGQLSEMVGKGESKPEEVDSSGTTSGESSEDGATPGTSGGERAPEVPAYETPAETSITPPRHAAEPGEIAL